MCPDTAVAALGREEQPAGWRGEAELPPCRGEEPPPTCLGEEPPPTCRGEEPPPTTGRGDICPEVTVAAGGFLLMTCILIFIFVFILS